MGAISFMRAKGQVTVPNEIREQSFLEEGDPVEFVVTEDGILMRPKKVIDSSQAWFWTANWQAGEREASEDIAVGRVTHHDSDEDFLLSLKRGGPHSK